MATSLVSGRVDDDIKERAGFYIRRAGLTTSDVIRTVWENIAKTGEIPQPVAGAHDTDEESPSYRHLLELQARTPRSDYLVELTPEDLKRELGSRDL